MEDINKIGPIETGLGEQDKILELLDVQKGQAYVVEQNNERYEIVINAEPVNEDKIDIKRTTPGALFGKTQEVSLDDLNRMIQRARNTI